jgi:hypothetical protein
MNIPSFFFSESRTFGRTDVHGGDKKRSWKCSYLEHAKLLGLMDLKMMESINNEEIRERREINKGQREGGKTES